MNNKTDDKLWNICMEIYREAYKKSEPSADFDKLIKSGEAHQPNFFMKYYLPNELLQKIIDKHTKGLSPHDKHRVEKEVMLGCTPTSVKDNWATKEGDGK